eukprot:1151457-Pelagomonas_calceolata.AAC.1
MHTHISTHPQSPPTHPHTPPPPPQTHTHTHLRRVDPPHPPLRPHALVVSPHSGRTTRPHPCPARTAWPHTSSNACAAWPRSPLACTTQLSVCTLSTRHLTTHVPTRNSRTVTGSRGERATAVTAGAGHHARTRRLRAHRAHLRARSWCSSCGAEWPRGCCLRSRHSHGRSGWARLWSHGTCPISSNDAAWPAFHAT